MNSAATFRRIAMKPDSYANSAAVRYTKDFSTVRIAAKNCSLVDWLLVDS